MKLFLTSPDAVSGSAWPVSAAPKRIQIARSGTFQGISGPRVTLTPALLASMAAKFDPSRPHKLKIGHSKIESDTPDWGDVKALEYDMAADRLWATIDPSEALIDKNRRERFRKVSLEAEGPSIDDLSVTHVAFLGAHGAAIDRLEPVMLAAGDSSSSSIELTMVASDPRIPALNTRIRFAADPIDDAALAFLASNPDTKLTYAKALEHVSLAARGRR